MFLEAMFKAQGRVRYPEIFPGVTMTCHMDGRFKDCFVYQDAASVLPIVFTISTALHPLLNKDGSVTLTDEAGQTMFTLTPPSLYDAKGLSGTAAVDLLPSDTGFTLTYTPDAAFMGSAAYPVTLDPSIHTVTDSSAVADTYVSSVYPNQNFQSNA